jgi:hypothetical protein
MWKKLEEESIKKLGDHVLTKNVNDQKHYPSLCAIITLGKRGVNPRALNSQNPSLRRERLNKCAKPKLTLSQSLSNIIIYKYKEETLQKDPLKNPKSIP